MADDIRTEPADAAGPDTPRPGDPTVVVSHLDIVYEVLGGGRRPADEDLDDDELRPLKNLLRRRRVERTREVHAVQDVSFIARHGESIGIIGRNGSGKSTLLRAVAGLIPPSSGRLWVAGEPSLLGVNAVLMKNLSGERNIYIGGQALGLSKTEISERFDEIVDFSGIGDAVYLPMGTYSSGMGARLRFAISTAAAPDVLMIDEALATGDADFREKSTRRIEEIRKEAATVFLVSHSNSSIRQVCDRVLWMDKGRLLMDGPTEEVLTAYEATLPKKASKAKKPSVPQDPDVPGTTRWGGNHRVQIAARITSRTWQPGVEGCFVVSTNHMATARIVTPVAARLGWPLLWVRPGALPATTRNELGRLAPQRVVVVGDDGQINPDTFERIQATVGGAAERFAHDGDVDVSAAVLRGFPPRDRSTVHVTHRNTTGRTPAVSLEAAVAGQAVIAWDAEHAPEDLRAALRDTNPDRLLFSGNEEDWPSDGIDELRAAADAEVEFGLRGGPMSLAAGLWDEVPPGGRVMVAGRSTLELLTASVAAVHSATPLLIIAPDRIPKMVQRTLERLAPSHVVLAGSVESLPPEIRRTIGEFVDLVIDEDDETPSA